MVNASEIYDLVKSKFVIHDPIYVDPSSGVVDVKGNVEAPENTLDQIPVKFGTIHGYFNLRRQEQLSSLVGSPRHVHGLFKVKSIVLTNLMGAPDRVDGECWISSPKLQSLEYLPLLGAKSYLIMWTEQLPLLRLLEAHQVRWGSYSDHRDNKNDAYIAIMKKYIGEGKRAMLNCALELKKAGYVGNARW